MYKQDIEGSIAHATMLGEAGIISHEDSELIVSELHKILDDIEAGKVEFSIDAEDIHMNIETILTNRIGDAGKRLHTAAQPQRSGSRFDIRMYLLSETKVLKAKILGLLSAISDKAKANIDTVMAGYTHLQRRAAGDPRTLYFGLRADAYT